jgi:hypothetical protein
MNRMTVSIPSPRRITTGLLTAIALVAMIGELMAQPAARIHSGPKTVEAKIVEVRGESATIDAGNQDGLRA